MENGRKGRGRRRRGDSYLQLLEVLTAKELGIRPKPPSEKTVMPVTAGAGIKVLETPEELVAALVEIKGFRGLVAALVAARCWGHELLQSHKLQATLCEAICVAVQQEWPKQFSAEELKEFLYRQAEIGEMSSLWPGQTKILNSLLTIFEGVIGSAAAKNLLATEEMLWRLAAPHRRRELRQWLEQNAKLKHSLLANPALRQRIMTLLETPVENSPASPEKAARAAADNILPFRSYMAPTRGVRE